MASISEPLRRTWDNFNEREKRLVSAMIAGVVAFFIFGIFFLISRNVADIEEENTAITEILHRIADERTKLAQRAEDHRRAEQRYSQKAPSLGSFVEATSKDNGLTLREVTDEPEETVSGYKKRAVRVSLPNVHLKPVIDLIAAIENSPFPVAIEKLQIEHFQSGDTYNVQMNVVAYDKPAAPPSHSKKPGAASTDDTATQ